MDSKAIAEVLQKGERVTLECKRAQTDVPNDMWNTYSAFANTYGGLIMLGVQETLNEKDLRKRFTITGVDDADKIRKDICNTLNNAEKVSCNLLRDEDIETVEIEGKKVVVIKVPQAEANVRPVYINNNPIRGTFVRNHEGDYHCPQEMITMMMRDANHDGNDRLFLKNYTMDDIDIPTLERYRQRFLNKYAEHPFNSLDNKEFLRQMGGYMKERNTGEEGLTMAGLLMFGKGLSVRERFDNLRMDYIDRSQLIGDERYSDRLTYDGMWENNLFNFATMVLPKLTRELPRPFRMEGLLRDDDTAQHKALREAMTNAIIHSDFMLNGVLKVEKYDDKFVFTNPGLLRLPIEQIYTGNETRARNQRIQTMFRMIGFGENIGSGFPLILNAWNEKHWLKPELIEQRNLLQVKLVLTIGANEGANDNDDNDHDNDRDNDHDIKGDINDTNHDNKSGGDDINDINHDIKGGGDDINHDIKGDGDDIKDDIKELSERQRNIVSRIEKDGRMSIPQLAKEISISPSTIVREIETLKRAGVLCREGNTRSGRWVVKRKE